MAGSESTTTPAPICPLRQFFLLLLLYNNDKEEEEEGMPLYNKDDVDATTVRCIKL